MDYRNGLEHSSDLGSELSSLAGVTVLVAVAVSVVSRVLELDTSLGHAVADSVELQT